jgi:hypothetical protein
MSHVCSIRHSERLMRWQPTRRWRRALLGAGESFCLRDHRQEIRYGANRPRHDWERADADLFPHLTVLALDQPVAALAGTCGPNGSGWDPVGYLTALRSDGEALGRRLSPQRAPL